MIRRFIGLLGVILVLLGGPSCVQEPLHAKPKAKDKKATPAKIQKTQAQWREQLTPQQFHILREKGTERAFSGAYWNEKRLGEYRCAGCNALLFASDTKFKSGTGWPSFYAPSAKEAITVEEDRSLGVVREEILCAQCGGHLGHVFDDGPKPTGLRYCVNSASLKFEVKTEASPAPATPKNKPIKKAAVQP